MARISKPIDECVHKRIILCGEARKNVMRLKATLLLEGKIYTEAQIINKMLREFK
jgi:hypothetical protein